ncbi:MAG TPA: hypothetical protein VFO40_23405, partial [Chthoniobacterales bacterium]|nr:hypothetical protein [Chthoniobacterales bacterium]
NLSCGQTCREDNCKIWTYQNWCELDVTVELLQERFGDFTHCWKSFRDEWQEIQPTSYRIDAKQRAFSFINRPDLATVWEAIHSEYLTAAAFSISRWRLH